MENRIRIGTRGSRLALWQAEHVASMLGSAKILTDIVTLETKGDKNISQGFQEIGTKGIFTEEIENKLLEGEIDIAVHSAKDMQSSLPSGLEIVAFLKRELPCDVLVSSNKSITLENMGEFRIGTSSARRKALLKHYYPGVRIEESRGNLQTRIKKMEDGMYDALILAFAGIHRLNYDSLIRAQLPLDKFTPAVAQGSIAVECSTNLDQEKRLLLKRILNDSETELCLKAERSFLRRLEGGCSIPIFCLAEILPSGIHLEGGITNPNGTRILRNTIGGMPQDGELLGIRLAEAILAQGGTEILEEIKHN